MRVSGTSMAVGDLSTRGPNSAGCPSRRVPSLVWNFPMTLSGDFDGSLSGGEVKRLSELSTERAPTVDLP